MSDVIIYTDGGARNNPGPAGVGVLIYESGRKVAELKKFLGSQTNNWAEYEALVLALEEAKRLGLAGRECEIRMDSELVVKQMRGEYRVKEPSLKPQHAKVKQLVADFAAVRFVHVPREENREADRLVNEAIDSGVQ
ncbi:MAG: ribonuclease HI family protein [Patescibacteria group bacterium]